MQYPAGTPEISSAVSENLTNGGQGAATTGAQVGYKRNAFIGSCKHHIWQAIRASSAAPYYLDDFSDGTYLFVRSLCDIFLGSFFFVIDRSLVNFSLSYFLKFKCYRYISLARWGYCS